MLKLNQKEPKGGENMHSWEAIERVLNYMEEHMNEDLMTEQLAEMAGLSPFYFQRLFKRLVGKSVQEYVKLRRLAHSVEWLNIPEKRIIDIALECGYSSHANYTRAFKEVFAITPEEYRKQYPTLNTCKKPEISMYYSVVDEGVPLIAGDIILEITKRRLVEPEYYLGYEGAVSISGQTPAGEVCGIDVPGELWKQFHVAKSEMDTFFTNNIELGVSHSPNPETDSFLYFTGGSIENGSVPSGSNMTIFTLEPGEYIVCQIEADSWKNLVQNALYQANNYLFGTWLPKHELTALPFAAEKYFLDNKEESCMELWIKVNTDEILKIY